MYINAYYAKITLKNRCISHDFFLVANHSTDDIFKEIDIEFLIRQLQ